MASSKKKTRKQTAKSNDDTGGRGGRSGAAKYPRHALAAALRIPRAILDQNAGKEATLAEVAGFIGVKSTSGPFNVEIGSATKFGLLDRPSSGRLRPSDLAKKILRPQDPREELQGYREAVMLAPQIADVYNHYRGENLPDDKFFANALTDKFGLPVENVPEFKSVFIDTLETAQLLARHNDKIRIVDVSGEEGSAVPPSQDRIEKLGKAVKVDANDTCFVMMPFADPHGGYYEKIYEPAVARTGLRAIRADDTIFATGKIIDQIWSGINSAKVLVAELSTRNPNVFYELGLAHALEKPVVLVSSNEADVPFDLQHIRVIYYDVNDPFWGTKLIEKIAENILSALKTPEEAIFKRREK